MNLQESYWWPLELSPRVERALDGFARETLAPGVRPDLARLEAAITTLGDAMRPHLAEIIERDGLPHLAHAIVGWGDASWQGQSLTDRIGPFVSDSAFGPCIPQCDPEGDFHPWQSLAYAVMAGAEPDRSIGASKASLRDLARNSRALQTGEGRELGHLLFGLADLDPDVDGRPFVLTHGRVPVRELLDMAVHAHHFGAFDVCRKFHLTEGLCAASSRIPGLESYRPHAEGFLEGQMNMLVLFALLLHEIRRAVDGQGEDDLVQELRHALRIGNNLENHVFYAGHLIELSGFAQRDGFALTETQASAIAFVLDEMNRTLDKWLRRLSFPDCFLSLGHYRRAATLWGELERARAERRALDRADLRRYAVAFGDATQPTAPAAPAAPPPGSIYEVARTQSQMRPAFATMLDAYDQNAPGDGLRARGRFDHFRRIGPPHWPRALHYEILDHGNAVGVEVHLEHDAVLPLRPLLIDLTERVRPLFPSATVVWDPRWYKGRGRLVVHHDAHHDPGTIAGSMRTLIDATYREIDAAVGQVAR
jgi:hypothetical protein